MTSVGIRRLRLFQVYLSTSSTVVYPSRMHRMPSSRRVRMPISTALSRMTSVGLRWLIRAWTGSVMRRYSKMPRRPRYPVSLQFLHPAPK